MRSIELVHVETAVSEFQIEARPLVAMICFLAETLRNEDHASDVWDHFMTHDANADLHPGQVVLAKLTEELREVIEGFTARLTAIAEGAR